MASGICTMCGEDFAGVAYFDSHLIEVPDPREDREFPLVKCVSPESVGLIKNTRGRWGSGPSGGPAARVYVPAAERPAHEYERECVVCDKVFMRPRKRGRPPTKCEDCR